MFLIFSFYNIFYIKYYNFYYYYFFKFNIVDIPLINQTNNDPVLKYDFIIYWVIPYYKF